MVSRTSHGIIVISYWTREYSPARCVVADPLSCDHDVPLSLAPRDAPPNGCRWCLSVVHATGCVVAGSWRRLSPESGALSSDALSCEANAYHAPAPESSDHRPCSEQ